MKLPACYLLARVPCGMEGGILMKYLKVVIDMVLEVPDDTEVMTPEDGDELPYVRINV
jgi:hypothetical protein